MRKLTIAICAVAAATLGSCGEAGDGPPATQATANQTVAAPKEKTPYCFFKDAETKDWSASRAKDGSITVKGRAYRSDPRYKAVLGEPKIDGATAVFRPSITVNDTGYAANENWWDVSATIPGNAPVETVEVRCGKKVLAEFELPRGE